MDYHEENLGLLNIPKGMLAKEETKELISLISKGKKNFSEQIPSFEFLWSFIPVQGLKPLIHYGLKC